MRVRVRRVDRVAGRSSAAGLVPEKNPSMMNTLFQSRIVRRTLLGAGLLFIGAVLLVLFFPWDALREPINRRVSERIGRHFAITEHLSVRPGFPATVLARGVEIANPPWADQPFLLKADAAEFDVALWPLLMGKVVLPRVVLTAPVLGLQVEPDGRRTWVFAREASDDPPVPPDIGSVMVETGTVNYLASARGARITIGFSLDRDGAASAGPLPLAFQAQGTWKKQAFAARGRTGGVLQFSGATGVSRSPLPFEIEANVAATRLKAEGSVVSLADLGGLDAAVDLRGKNLQDLYQLLGVVLPATPAYAVRGRVVRSGPQWSVGGLNGVLGRSDISGDLQFDTSGAVPRLAGTLRSKVLDFEDLGPMIGRAPTRGAAVRPVAGGRVLPSARLDFSRLKAMDADVRYSAADIRHAKALPLDKASAQVTLRGGVLLLEPVSLGVAGGSLAGRIRIDANAEPAVIQTRLDARAVQLNQLFPTVKNTQSSLGRISGQFDLTGRGDSVAQMLGSASGDVAVLTGKGQISNILLEFMGLDGGEIIKFLVRGDRNVQLRCAAAAFDVKQGLMTSRAIVLDTSDTLIQGQGQISLANETLDLLLKPQPKDRSILSLRSPLRITGTFASPQAGPDTAALAGRAGIALLLGAINPLLALAATLETGPGQDADCVAVLAAAAKSAPAK